MNIHTYKPLSTKEQIVEAIQLLHIAGESMVAGQFKEQGYGVYELVNDLHVVKQMLIRAVLDMEVDND